MAPEEQKTANELAAERTSLAGERTDIAFQRTVMAANRTLMAWVRTALSMISFGFTIYKFLNALPLGEGVAVLNAHSPRRIGLLLIGLGTASMIMGSVEYVQTMNGLSKLSGKRYNPLNFLMSMGIMIGLLGLFLFFTILANMEFF